MDYDQSTIEAIALAGYRSFGPELQYLDPLSKLNLIAGPNNSGKSNILRFITKWIPEITRAIKTRNTLEQFDPALDAHRGANGTAPFVSGIGYHTDNPFFVELQNGLPERDKLDYLLDKLRWNSATRTIWTMLELGADQQVTYKWKTDEIESLAFPRGTRLVGSGTLERWLNHINPHSGAHGRSTKNELYTFLRHICRWPPFDGIKTVLIPAVREVRPESADDSEHGGAGLIEKLDKLQRPEWTDDHLRQRFAAICGLLRDVSGDETISIDIPSSRRLIQVRSGDKLLPLSSFGSGIQELIIIAATATVETNAIICIEEPEIHLHARFQRKLIEYLATQTSNQYFITTHSAHLLDAPNVSIFRTSLEDDETKVAHIRASNDKWQLADALGCRGSDIVQANCVIWVEGPSDRIYLNHWLSACSESPLREGIEYSIMFYGGKLLSHLCAEEPEVSEFISLCAINRNAAVVMDSDRRARGTQANRTKRRIRSEINNVGGFVWITDGREIENYVCPVIMRQSMEQLREGSTHEMEFGKYDKIVTSSSRIDKILLAREVCKLAPKLDVLDLNTKIRSLAQFIRRANHLPD